MAVTTELLQFPCVQTGRSRSYDGRAGCRDGRFGAAEFHVVVPGRQTPALHAGQVEALRELLHRYRQGLP